MFSLLIGYSKLSRIRKTSACRAISLFKYLVNSFVFFTSMAINRWFISLM